MAKKDILAMQKRSHDLGYRIGRMEQELHFTEHNLKEFERRRDEAKKKGDNDHAADLQKNVSMETQKIKLLKKQIAKDKKEEKKIMDQLRKMTR